MRLMTGFYLSIGFCAFALQPLMASPAPTNTTPFVLYDNMFYKHKPNTAPDGFVASNILYEGLVWPGQPKPSGLPDRNAFEALVRSHIANPGPLVIDIESLPLRGAQAGANESVLATLADWAHEAAPGKIIGYYGTNTLSRVAPADLNYARDLTKHIDAFFPPAYTFDDDRNAWAQTTAQSVADAHALDPAKPVYLYLWPQYHDGTPKAFQFIDADYWTYELETAYRTANGFVLWSPSKYEWNDSTGWWSATQRVVRAHAAH